LTHSALFANGLFSLVTLKAYSWARDAERLVQTLVWYAKQEPTIALVRRYLWSRYHFELSKSKADIVKIPRSLLERLTDSMCQAA